MSFSVWELMSHTLILQRVRSEIQMFWLLKSELSAFYILWFHHTHLIEMLFFCVVCWSWWTLQVNMQWSDNIRMFIKLLVLLEFSSLHTFFASLFALEVGEDVPKVPSLMKTVLGTILWWDRTQRHWKQGRYHLSEVVSLNLLTWLASKWGQIRLAVKTISQKLILEKGNDRFWLLLTPAKIE